MATATPWAILLCKFSDDDSEPRPRGHYERLFTISGAGTQNMTDDFHTMSHGALDLSGSRVFGWYTLPRKRSEYTGSGPNWQGRQDLVNWARQAAADAGDDISGYYGVVVSMNVPTDLFGGGGRQAVCDLNSLQPSVLGQEMGHGYGLDHSRIDGSEDDYRDRWDTMSTWDSCYMTSHPDYEWIGPGLNAANMRGRGWLDESRVWRGGGDSYDTAVTLRPLHRRDLPGWLAAELPNGLLVEFRMDDRWDAGIPAPAVLVHWLTDNHSYLTRGRNGQEALVAGDAFGRDETGIAARIFGTSGTSFTVDSIDPGAQTATIHIVRRRAAHIPELAGSVFGGVAVDGGGFIVVGGKIVKIPPRSPLARLADQIALYQSTSTPRMKSHVRDALRRGILDSMSQEIDAMRDETGPFHSPPPIDEEAVRGREHR